MNVTIEITNDCDSQWVPDQETCENWIQTALDLLGENKQYNVSLCLVDEAGSKDLNYRYCGKQNATNVLSFPSQLPLVFSKQLETTLLGDVVICPAILNKEADELGKTPEAHWIHLLIHGVLHLLGYDHKTDGSAAIMEQLEIDILEKLGFPNPYLIG